MSINIKFRFKWRRFFRGLNYLKNHKNNDRCWRNALFKNISNIKLLEKVIEYFRNINLFDSLSSFYQVDCPKGNHFLIKTRYYHSNFPVFMIFKFNKMLKREINRYLHSITLDLLPDPSNS